MLFSISKWISDRSFQPESIFIGLNGILNQKGIDFKEYPIDGDPDARIAMSQRADGRTTVPQIFINEKGIGGCDELYELDSSQQLDDLLN